MMRINNIFSMRYEADNVIIIDLDYNENEINYRIVTAYRASDPYSPLTPLITQWLTDNTPEILPYITPPAPTPNELRAQMPTLSSRQFWLAANTLGITEDMLIASTDDAEIIIEIRKTTEFHRTYDSVVMLAPLMGVTAEQLDGVWLWAAAV